jgi:hypothetical protein
VKNLTYRLNGVRRLILLRKLFSYKLVALLLLTFPLSSHALILGELVRLEKMEQAHYIMGVLDVSITDDTLLGREKRKCVEDWGLKGAWLFLQEFYSKGPNDATRLSFNVALIISMGESKACSKPKKLQPSKSKEAK